MANTIKIKQSSVASRVPAASDLEQGELAINTADEKLYTKNSSGSVVEIGGGSGGDVVTDTTPQLGGDLDLNSSDITGTGNIDITGEITADKVTAHLNGPVEFTARNESGATLSKGDVVYISGVSGTTPLVALADCSNSAKMPAFGLVESDAANNSNVTIVTFGNLINVDTSAFSAGDTLYVSTGGNLTSTKPTGQSNLLQNIGIVQRSHATAGSIKVGGAGRTATTPNLNNGNVFIGNASNQAVARQLTHDDIGSGTVTTDSIALTGNMTVTGTVDGRDVSADGTKLDTIATNANNYVHPTFAGDDINVDTGPLTGAVVVSDIDFNVTTDTNGHVTDANGIVNTRTLTLADLGYTGETNATADQTASEILTAIKTVDGSGSGLDADLLDGRETSDTGGVDKVVLTNSSGHLNVGSGDVEAAGVYVGAKNASYDFYNNGTTYLNGATTIDAATNINGTLTVDNGTDTTLSVKCDDGGRALIRANGDSQGTGVLEVGQSDSYGGGISYNGDGTPAWASGETADNITFYRLENGTRTEVFHYPYNSNTVNFNSTPTVSGSSVWHAGNDGSGSGLDADTVDGIQASSFLRSDASDTTTGDLTVEGKVVTNELRNRTGQQLVLSAGESYAYATGQTGEYVYVNAEEGLQVNTSPDNWVSGWAGRDTTTIHGEHITTPEIRLNDTNTKLQEGGNNSVKVQNNMGYVEIGPQNSTLCHFYTDKTQYYFNRKLHAVDEIAIYNDNGTKLDTTGVFDNGNRVYSALNPPPATASLTDVTEFTSSGTISVPSGANHCLITAVGGGGGGAGGSGGQTGSNTVSGGSSGSGGGGAGASTLKEVFAVTSGTITVTIGAGGTGGAAGTNTSNYGNLGVAGNAGGATTINGAGLSLGFGGGAGGGVGSKRSNSTKVGGAGGAGGTINHSSNNTRTGVAGAAGTQGDSHNSSNNRPSGGYGGDPGLGVGVGSDGWDGWNGALRNSVNSYRGGGGGGGQGKRGSGTNPQAGQDGSSGYVSIEFLE